MIPACIMACAWHTGHDACQDRYNPEGGETIPGIPGACTTHNFTYLVRGPGREGISWALNSHLDLTDWGWDEIDNLFQTTFSDSFSWLKMYQFWLWFHWSLFLWFKLYNIPALVGIIAWRRPGDKPLSEAVMVSLLMHICITQHHSVS